MQKRILVKAIEIAIQAYDWCICKGYVMDRTIKDHLDKALELAKQS